MIDSVFDAYDEHLCKPVFRKSPREHHGDGRIEIIPFLHGKLTADGQLVGPLRNNPVSLASPVVTQPDDGSPDIDLMMNRATTLRKNGEP
jgi:hypothetical protein